VAIRGFGRFEVRYTRLTRGHTRHLRVVFSPYQTMRALVSGQPDSSHHTPPGTPRRRLLGRP
jgi:hypothetical protein